ncbi:M20/M25/M40 family metallo-hydrolase [Pseudalkalibacillus caeni]|uniref:M20/M25/M40 family metallo-hydrolase n=1 Tax=Exobacillus caeni TaxID=2574798 RepID=A0A5R9F9E3_9BACL|nr:M20/M25/M40 family metallo-hydrolase [Pseudalkalibacillus caeni]TLS38886.1 M20/M25/M40 family metallo-hydrolase [Pseudalkalibacillus caeni]
MKQRKALLVLFALALVFTMYSSLALAKPLTKKEAPGSIAYNHVTVLADDFGDRQAGTADEQNTQKYITSIFDQLGYNPSIQEFSFERNDQEIDSSNVIAVKKGKFEQEIIIGAHYDTVNDVQGVDDNGSGVAVMLEVAERLQKAKPHYTIKFVAFGAEERGLQGSKYYVSRMSQEEADNTVAMINLDSLAAGDHMYVYGGAGEKGWVRDLALDIAEKRKLDVNTNPGINEDYPAGTTGDWSDHAPFKNAGIPYAYFEATNWEIGALDGYTQTVKHGEIWHEPGKDTLEFIQTEFPGRMENHLSTFSQLLTELVLKINYGTVQKSN